MRGCKANAPRALKPTCCEKQERAQKILVSWNGEGGKEERT